MNGLRLELKQVTEQDIKHAVKSDAYNEKGKLKKISSAQDLNPAKSKHDALVASNVQGLNYFNALVVIYMSGTSSLHVHAARLHAIEHMERKAPAMLEKLCKCFHGLWPHWAANGCRYVIERLQYTPGLPIKSPLAGLATMGGVRTVKSGGRHKRVAVPSAEICEYHADRKAIANGLCGCCNARRSKLRKQGIIDDFTDRSTVALLLNFPIVNKGDRSFGVHVQRILKLTLTGRA